MHRFVRYSRQQWNYETTQCFAVSSVCIYYCVYIFVYIFLYQIFRKKHNGVVLSKRTIQDENNKWVRFVGIGLPPIGPLNSNTARNTADVIVTVDKAMNHPDWPQARRYLSSGKGGIREFRKLLSVPIMSEARLLAVVLAMETDSTIIDVCNRVGVETARHDDEILVR